MRPASFISYVLRLPSAFAMVFGPLQRSLFPALPRSAFGAKQEKGDVYFWSFTQDGASLVLGYFRSSRWDWGDGGKDGSYGKFDQGTNRQEFRPSPSISAFICVICGHEMPWTIWAKRL